jgi:peptide chain release factor subunit 3
MLAKTAGVRRLIVAINKMDDHTVNWSKERYDECCDKLLPFLKQVGYNPKSDLDFMPISGSLSCSNHLMIKDSLAPT